MRPLVAISLLGSCIVACSAIGGLDSLDVDPCFNGCADGGTEGGTATVPPSGAPDGGAEGGSDCPTGFATCPSSPAACGIATASDRFNCGSCGHDCGGGSCLAGACQPFALASGQMAPVGLAVIGATVYFGTGEGIRSVSTNGGTAAPVWSGASGATWIQTNGAGPLWIDGANNISRVAFDKTGYVVLQSSVATLWDMVADDASIYYNSGRNLNRASATGTGTPTRIAQGGTQIYAITADTTTLYCFEASGTVFKVAKTAPADSPPEVLTTIGPADAQSSVNDATNVYWITVDGLVESLPKSGGDMKQLAQGLGALTDMAVDDKDIYVTADTGILRVPLDGAAVGVVAAGLSSPQGIVIDGAFLYFTTTDGKVMKLAK